MIAARVVVGIFTTAKEFAALDRPWLPVADLQTAAVPVGVSFVYVVGAGPGANRAVVLNFPEGMNNGKSFEWFRTAPERFPSATHIFKMDTDTAICPSALEQMLMHTLSSNPSYVGRIHNHSSCGGFPHCPPKTGATWSYMSGALYGMSTKAATCLRDAYSGPIAGIEDLMIGKALHAVCGVTSSPLPCLCQGSPPCNNSCPAWHMQSAKSGANKPLCAVTMAECPYRLSDIVAGFGKSRECACADPESLACRYLSATAAPKDLTVLAGLVAGVLRDKPWLRIPKTTTVIHVRAGDGITGPRCFSDPSDCFKTAGGGQYGMHKAIFDAMNIDRRQPCAIYVNTVHCTAHECNPEHQQQYMQDVVRYLTGKCASVAVRANNPPDDAFVSMASANTLIVTGGQFGALARRLSAML